MVFVGSDIFGGERYGCGLAAKHCGMFVEAKMVGTNCEGGRFVGWGIAPWHWCWNRKELGGKIPPHKPSTRDLMGTASFHLKLPSVQNGHIQSTNGRETEAVITNDVSNSIAASDGSYHSPQIHWVVFESWKLIFSLLQLECHPPCSLRCSAISLH